MPTIVTFSDGTSRTSATVWDIACETADVTGTLQHPRAQAENLIIEKDTYLAAAKQKL